MIRKLLLLSLSISLLFTGCAAQETAATDSRTAENVGERSELTVVENNNPTQERIDALIDTAMHYYWHGGDVKKVEDEFFRGVTLKGNYDVVEACFTQAILLNPLDTDLQRSLALTKVLNSDLDGSVEILKTVIEVDPDNYDALMQYYVFSGVQQGDFNGEILDKLKNLDKDRTEVFVKDFELLESIRSNPVNTEIKEYEDNHTFVLLGYALDDKGNMQDTMRERLEYTLEVLEKNPTANIILSGGVPKNGNNEAQVMKDWLVEKGISEDRITEENLSTDTVENSLFSIRKAGGSENITVISSASHIRRALLLFTAADRIVNESLIESDRVNRTIDAIGQPDDEELIEASSDSERLVMYRDLLRLEGIWQYPGVQR